MIHPFLVDMQNHYLFHEDFYNSAVMMFAEIYMKLPIKCQLLFYVHIFLPLYNAVVVLLL
jgi:hypothetical protein